MFFPFQMTSLLWLYERFQYAYRTVTVRFEYGPANGPLRGVIMESEFAKGLGYVLPSIQTMKRWSRPTFTAGALPHA
jgi:hypothetical protein